MAPEHSLASDLSCAPPVAAATAGPPPAQPGRLWARVYASSITDRRYFYACPRDHLEICSTVAAIFSGRPNRVALSAWAIIPTRLLSSSTMGFAAPDLVGSRSRACCKSPPWRHVDGRKSLRPLWPLHRHAPLHPDREIVVSDNAHRIRRLRLPPIGTEPISSSASILRHPGGSCRRNTAVWLVLSL